MTWQSTSKVQHQARKFLAGGGANPLRGTMFVIEVKTGKEIDAFSAFPEEAEVLLKFNTFFKVVAKLQTEAEKQSRLGDLAAYNMAALDVYVMKQI